MDNKGPDQLLLSEFKDLFKQEYVVQMNKRLFLEGLSNLAKKQMEAMNKVISRIMRTVWVIKETFKGYGGVIPYPNNDHNDGISNHSFRAFMRQHRDVQLFQDETIQGCTHSGTQGSGCSTGFGHHDDQKDVPSCHYSPKRRQMQISGFNQ